MGKTQQAAAPGAGHSTNHFLLDELIKLPKHNAGKHHYTHFTDEKTEAKEDFLKNHDRSVSEWQSEASPDVTQSSHSCFPHPCRPRC